MADSGQRTADSPHAGQHSVGEGTLICLATKLKLCVVARRLIIKVLLLPIDLASVKYVVHNSGYIVARTRHHDTAPTRNLPTHPSKTQSTPPHQDSLLSLPSLFAFIGLRRRLRPPGERLCCAACTRLVSDSDAWRTAANSDSALRLVRRKRQERRRRPRTQPSARHVVFAPLSHHRQRRHLRKRHPAQSWKHQAVAGLCELQTPIWISARAMLCARARV